MRTRQQRNMHTSETDGLDARTEPPRATDVAVERQGDDKEAPVFLLSPASLSGVRGSRLLAGVGGASVVERLVRGEGVSIAEVYTAISSLYFRGKLVYSRRYGRLPHSLGIRVITSDRGLYAADDLVDLDDLRRMASAAIDERDPTYRRCLTDSARELARQLTDECIVVLLGSVATRKYLDPLRESLGERLRIPREFIGLGDMSRGGLLLRAASEGRQLEYIEPPPREPVPRGRRAPLER
jgi:hypothetical protein